MNAKPCSLLCLFVLLGSSAWAAPPQRSTFDPNNPEKTRPIIAREERGKLGLSPRNWDGVVHPDVYPTLERLDRTVAELTARAAQGAERAQKTGRHDPDGSEAIRRLSGIRFSGTAYVQVHLKCEFQGEENSPENKAAIKQVQGRVLDSLTAAEFYAPYLFETHSGLTAFATRQALDKLAKNPDVVGICLDDKPIPDALKTIYRSDLPPAGSDDTSGTQPGVAEGKVEAEVYRAFELSDRVDVVIGLNNESVPNITDQPAEMWMRQELRKQAVDQLQKRVLSPVSAEEFWLWSKLWIAPSMSGAINKEGLEKLRQHPDVLRIGLPQGLVRIPERRIGNRFIP